MMISAPYTQFKTISSGVDLYCRSYGNGDPLLMIHGACTDSDFFSETAAILSNHYTVIIYDRRGYGRSSDVPTERCSTANQTEDAAKIIRGIGAPCFVVGHSAGTTIAMELAVACPELVRKTLLYEPVVANCLPADDPRLLKLEKIRDFTQTGRYGRAINRFLPLIGEKDSRGRDLTSGEEERLMRNSMAFMQGEFDAVFYYEPKYEKLHFMPLAVGVGEMSRGSHRWIVSHTLAERIGCPIIYFPGAHNCAFDLPQEFAYLIHGMFSDAAAQS